MSWTAHLDTAAVCAVAAALGALEMPRRIAALAEPAPDPEPTDEELARKEARAQAAAERNAKRRRPRTPPEPEPPKEPYVTLAARSGLRVRLAIACAVAGLVIGLALGWQWSLVFLVPLVPVCAALAYIDWNTRLLPLDLVRPTYVIVAVGIGIATVGSRDLGDLERAVLGWLIAGGLYGLLWFVYPPGLGFGDVRLAGVLGLALGYVGWGELFVGVYAGFLLGGVLGGLLRVSHVVRQKHVPFGPFMLVGALVGIAWGADLWSHLVVTSG